MGISRDVSEFIQRTIIRLSLRAIRICMWMLCAALAGGTEASRVASPAQEASSFNLALVRALTSEYLLRTPYFHTIAGSSQCVMAEPLSLSLSLFASHQ